MAQKNLATKQTETHRNRQQMCGCQGGGGGGRHQELAISRCKQLYIGWINNKVYYTAQ